MLKKRATAPTESTTATATVLLVDDDEDAFVLTRDLLDELPGHPYDVLWCDNAAQAAARMAAPEVDVALVDYRLGATTGADVIRAARAAGVMKPLILLTGLDDVRVAVEAMQAGAADYAVKDRLTGDELDRTIRRAREHARLAETLDAERRHAAAIIDTIDALIVTLDRDGRVVQFNAAAERLTGYSRDEARGLVVWDTFAAVDHQGEGARLFAALIAGGEAAQEARALEFPWRTRNGDVHMITWRNAVMSASGNGEPLVIATGVDVSDQVKRERMLRQSAKLAAIGELTGNFAHEVNNPIGIISAKVRLLLSRERGAMSEHVADELEKVVEQCDRLARLTRRLLDFARPAQSERARIDAHTPVRAAVNLVAHAAQRQNITLVERLSAEHPFVVANENELQQVFLNLLINAVDAQPHGGRIEVESHWEPEAPARLAVRVRDTGPGIAGANLDRIFEPFFTTKRDAHGTGLGLAICSGLVRAHGGTIEVQSPPGSGACFVVRLPSAAE